VSHGAYVDKTFFVVELFGLVSQSGLAYGLDAALRPHVPASLASALMGRAHDELARDAAHQATPVGIPAT